ncbi:ABC transporter permease [Enterocloster lavalensis]|uniref:ABC transporter permease n=1 Tax=Enterocloster lavalensis TaxID=460384 RepID=UPI001DB4F19B|nr:ABC transporter permease [Enterocloster lavalensis]MBS5602970.1 ABC transporter permease [Enterocloster asparagiformis]
MADHIQKEKMTFREIFISYGAVIALAVLIVFNGIVTKNFLSLNTLWLVIKQSTPILFMTVGMTFVISSGGIDISTGSMMAFCGIIVSLGITNGGNFWVWCLIGLAACAAIGVFNGFLISSVGVQPVILTLVMQIVMRGVTVLMAKSSVFVLGGYPEIKTLGIYRFPGRVPIQIVFFILIVIVSVFVLRKTLLGKYVEAVGSNPKAARLTGVRTVAVIITVYVISAVLAGSCGILEMCRNAALDPNELGKLYELDAIAGVAVGGTSMKGGKANIVGSIAGCLIMVLIGTTVNMNGIPFATSNIIKAAIIIFALAIQRERSV